VSATGQGHAKASAFDIPADGAPAGRECGLVRTAGDMHAAGAIGRGAAWRGGGAGLGVPRAYGVGGRRCADQRDQHREYPAQPAKAAGPRARRFRGARRGSGGRRDRRLVSVRSCRRVGWRGGGSVAGQRGGLSRPEGADARHLGSGGVVRMGRGRWRAGRHVRFTALRRGRRPRWARGWPGGAAFRWRRRGRVDAGRLVWAAGSKATWIDGEVVRGCR